MEQSLQVLSKQERLEQWSGKIAACRGSGMTVRAWCQERGISEKTYYYWQRRLFQESTRTQAQGSDFHWILWRTVCFFSAEEGGTESRPYIGRETAFFSSTSVWNRASSSGRGKKARPKPSPCSNTAGSWRDSALTSQKRIGR